MPRVAVAVLVVCGCATAVVSPPATEELAAPQEDSPPTGAAPSRDELLETCVETEPLEDIRFRTDVMPLWATLQHLAHHEVRFPHATSIHKEPSATSSVVGTHHASKKHGSVSPLGWIYVTERAGHARVLQARTLVAIPFGPATAVLNGSRGASGSAPRPGGIATVVVTLAPGEVVEILAADQHFVAVRGEVYWIESCGAPVAGTCAWSKDTQTDVAYDGAFALDDVPTTRAWFRVRSGDIEGWVPLEEAQLVSPVPKCGLSAFRAAPSALVPPAAAARSR